MESHRTTDATFAEAHLAETLGRTPTDERGERVDGKGIFRDAGPPIAWFRDPARNILSVLQTG